MKNIYKFLLLVFLSFLILAMPVKAVTPTPFNSGRCNNILIVDESGGSVIYTNSNIKYEFTVGDSGDYKIIIDGLAFTTHRNIKANNKISGTIGNVIRGNAFKEGSHRIIVEQKPNFRYCIISYNVVSLGSSTPIPSEANYEFPKCRIELSSNFVSGKNKQYSEKTNIFFKVNALNYNKKANHQVLIRERGCQDNEIPFDFSNKTGEGSIGLCNIGAYDAILQQEVYKVNPGGGIGGGHLEWEDTACRTTFQITKEGIEPTPVIPICLSVNRTKEDICSDIRCENLPECSISFTRKIKAEEVCKSIKNPIKQDACVDCFKKEKAFTAIGCIPTDVPTLLKDYVFKYGLGIAGGIAFLLMLWGGFTVLISAGDPQKITHGKEIITSALAGLLLIIFSVFILKFIGVDILRIPGFQ